MLDQLRTTIMRASEVFVVFGSPRRGLHEIVAEEGVKLDAVSSFIVNFVPNQGTHTIRTEEAVHSALTVLNAISE
jgi:predicted SPOUT superfamily RNA methylase MTH1